MDNAQKAIMIGVGLFITIIIIAAVMLITGAGQDLINGGMKKVSDLSTNLQSQLTAQYDGTTLTGSEVIAAVKSNYTTAGMIVAVNNGNGIKQYGKSKGDADIKENSSTNRYEVAGTTDNTAEKVGKLSSTASADKAYYVNPTVTYHADIIYLTDSDAVVGIYFHK